MRRRLVLLLAIMSLLTACTVDVARRQETTPAATSTPTPPLALVPTDTPQPAITPTLPTDTPQPTTTLKPPTATPVPPTPTSVKVTGPLLIDSAAGRIYAAGEVGQKAQTLVLAATDGHLLAAYDITGTLALDSVHAWLYMDQDERGLAVLDAQAGTRWQTIMLPNKSLPWQKNPAPQADPATGQVLAFRNNVMYVVDPQNIAGVRSVPFNFPQADNCRALTEPLPIEWALYDSTRRIVYLDFIAYQCTPWIGHSVMSYEIDSGTEITLSAVTSSNISQAIAFDGYMYGTGSSRLGVGYRWAWKDGRPWFESAEWLNSPGFVLDATRGRLYERGRGNLGVFDARTMVLLMIASVPVDGDLVGYDPQTDQLYFLSAGRLETWPASRLQPPAPEPLTASRPPTTALRSLVLSPAWVQDKTLFGLWGKTEMFDCRAWAQNGGPFHVSQDGGRTWSQPRSGPPVLSRCMATMAVSPDYAHDQTLFAGVVGLGLFKSTDAGQSWQPSSAGLPSMDIIQILLSPGFARDQTVFAWVRRVDNELYRSDDGGRTWKMIGARWDAVALSPEFEQDRTVMGVAWYYVGQTQIHELRLSLDGGDHWERVGDAPGGKGIVLLSLAPLFAKWHVLFAYGEYDTLYRSGDGGKSWQAVLSTAEAYAAQLVYAPNIEVNRPVFLLTTKGYYEEPLSMQGTLYRSGDGGLTWRTVQLPGGGMPTALAISPNFAQDELLFVGTADGRVLAVEDSALRGQNR